MLTTFASPVDAHNVNNFISNLDTLVESDMFYNEMAHVLLGENALPDRVLPLANDIRAEKDSIDSLLESSGNEEGIKLIHDSLGLSVDASKKFLADPKSASVLFRSLRDKLEEMEDRSKRAKAEDNGFFAMIIYTIKKAMAWLIKKFNDIRDYVMDVLKERPAGSSQAKRDYNFIKAKNDEYLARNTSWFLNSEH
jgi:hypothetical protein